MSPRAEDMIGELESRRPDAGLLRKLQADFRKFGFAKVSFIMPDQAKEEVAAEVRGLIEQAGIRRDVTLDATGGTPRRMRNVRQAEISRSGGAISQIYQLAPLRAMLSLVVGEPVLPCPYAPEQYVITRLERGGDTHGWHWDDYSFALVWIIECPAAENGGFVQCVPGTTWDKRDPAISKAFLSGPIYSFAMRPGDLYLMRTDTTLHRVYPITQGIRTIVNMGFASRADVSREISHETVDELWAADWPPPGRDLSKSSRQWSDQ